MQIADFRELQVAQQRHDHRNHLEILSLHKMERLKHYGLHYSKYVGRIARGLNEPKPLKTTFVDAMLICLSAANALNQRLWEEHIEIDYPGVDFLALADAVGRFADACEKLDHLEDFRELALGANKDIAGWLVAASDANQVDLLRGIEARRSALSLRHAYHAGA